MALSFDRHSSEQLRVLGERDNRVMTADADSAAHVVYDYFGGSKRLLANFGGGHEAAGTCQIDNDRAEPVPAELIPAIIDGGRELLAV